MENASTRLALTAIFTALVCVSTAIFSIYVPQTRGFFNIGETMVYVTALLFGPYVGAFAGGVGSMFADLILGYFHYAPATLIAKACEGGIVGFLSKKIPRFASEKNWKVLTLSVGVVVAALLVLIGASYYSGSVELYFGIPQPEAPTSTILVPAEFWYSLGAAAVLLMTVTGFTFDPELGWTVISIIAGGVVMVSGYYLYEQFFLGVFALSEVPVNIGQMTVGLIVSVPVVRAVWRYLPSLREGT